MEVKVGFRIDQDGITIMLHEPRRDLAAMQAATVLYSSFPSHSFTIPNDELAALQKHLLGLAKRAKAASKPRVKADLPAKHFDAFWSLYPASRRVGRQQVQVKWQANLLDEEWPLIERHLNQSMPEWAKEQFKYCPLVTTYINQRRWEAITEEVQPTIV